jgi:hypothetical protein
VKAERQGPYHELKALIHSGTKDAIAEIWKLMKFSKSEVMRLVLSEWLVERYMGKAVSMDGANIGAITFNVVTGVPDPDDDNVIIGVPRLPNGMIPRE